MYSLAEGGGAWMILTQRALVARGFMLQRMMEHHQFGHLPRLDPPQVAHLHCHPLWGLVNPHLVEQDHHHPYFTCGNQNPSKMQKFAGRHMGDLEFPFGFA